MHTHGYISHASVYVWRLYLQSQANNVVLCYTAGQALHSEQRWPAVYLINKYVI